MERAEIIKLIREQLEGGENRFLDFENFKLRDRITKALEEHYQNHSCSGVVLIFEEGQDVPSDRTIELLVEHVVYKRVPKSNFYYRYDHGTTNPPVQDHIHVFAGKTKNQVFSINRDGSGHDGSTGIPLPNRVRKFLPTIGFNVPKDGVIESLQLESGKEYWAIRYDFGDNLLLS